MNDDRARAERITDDAFRGSEFENPRGVYRERLKYLRETNPEAYERALGQYNEVLLAELNTGTDAIEAWLSYGGTLAAMTAEGVIYSIDATGRAAPQPKIQKVAGMLILHVPGDPSVPVLPIAIPTRPTPAQQATYKLLVDRSREL